VNQEESEHVENGKYSLIVFSHVKFPVIITIPSTSGIVYTFYTCG